MTVLPREGTVWQSQLARCSMTLSSWVLHFTTSVPLVITLSTLLHKQHLITNHTGCEISCNSTLTQCNLKVDVRFLMQNPLAGCFPVGGSQCRLGPGAAAAVCYQLT